MFGTLVIILPSEYKGGESIIEHNGQTETFSFSTDSKYKIKYIAFYADCKHEVKKITEGARLCLIYNLIHTSKTKKKPIADNNFPNTEAQLESYFKQNQFPNKKNVILRIYRKCRSYIRAAVPKSRHHSMEKGRLSLYF